jgi:hypothetical protein
MAMVLLHPENLRFLPAPAYGRQGRGQTKSLIGCLKNYHQLNELSTVLKSENKNIFFL